MFVFFLLILAVTVAALPEDLKQMVSPVKGRASKIPLPDKVVSNIKAAPGKEHAAATVSSLKPKDASMMSGCYANQDDSMPIPGCVCHHSCSSCGYYSNPVLFNDCITCSNGNTVFPHYNDGTGSCLPEVDVATATGCFSSSVDSIPGCTCHKSCKACGFSENPTSYTNCLSCKNSKAELVEDFHYPATFRYGEKYDIGHCASAPDNLALYEMLLKQEKEIEKLQRKVKK